MTELLGEKYNLSSFTENHRIVECHIPRAHLFSEVLNGLYLFRSRVENLNAIQSQLRGLRAIETSFVASDFVFVIFEDCYFRKVGFEHCGFRHVEFRRCTFDDCSFSFSQPLTEENELKLVDSISIDADGAVNELIHLEDETQKNEVLEAQVAPLPISTPLPQSIDIDTSSPHPKNSPPSRPQSRFDKLELDGAKVGS